MAIFLGAEEDFEINECIFNVGMLIAIASVIFQTNDGRHNCPARDEVS